MAYSSYVFDVVLTREQMISLLLDGKSVEVAVKDDKLVKINALSNTHNWPRFEGSDPMIEATAYVSFDGKNGWGKLKVSTKDQQAYTGSLDFDIEAGGMAE